jgi:hypothetical protein
LHEAEELIKAAADALRYYVNEKIAANNNFRLQRQIANGFCLFGTFSDWHNQSLPDQIPTTKEEMVILTTDFVKLNPTFEILAGSEGKRSVAAVADERGPEHVAQFGFGGIVDVAVFSFLKDTRVVIHTIKDGIMIILFEIDEGRNRTCADRLTMDLLLDCGHYDLLTVLPSYSQANSTERMDAAPSPVASGLSRAMSVSQKLGKKLHKDFGLQFMVCLYQTGFGKINN